MSWARWNTAVMFGVRVGAWACLWLALVVCYLAGGRGL